MAVRKAVRAATITFTATSTIRFVFISFTFHCSLFTIHCSLFTVQFCPKSPPLDLVNSLLATSLDTPSFMAIALTVVVALRENASL